VKKKPPDKKEEIAVKIQKEKIVIRKFKEKIVIKKLTDKKRKRKRPDVKKRLQKNAKMEKFAIKKPLKKFIKNGLLKDENGVEVGEIEKQSRSFLLGENNPKFHHELAGFLFKIW